jgi:RNA polymerase sigma-70 factor (family 1)
MNIENKNTEKCLCEESAFKLVFDSYFKVLRNFLIFRYKNFELAEDIAQNAFVKLWENCKILKKEQAKSFLFTTAIRLSLNQIKHQKIVANYEINFVSKSSDKESPQFILEENEFKIRLEKAINNLPQKQREVFLLNRFENQTYKEIAEQLDLSVKAVEKRMKLALESLRDVVKNI